MTRFLHLGTPERSAAASLWGVRDLRNRPQTATGGGRGIYQIEVGLPTDPVVVGSNQHQWEIPVDLDSSTMVAVDAYLSTASSSGLVQVQLQKLGSDGAGSPVDLLTTKISIDAGELNSRTAATPPVINTGVASFVYGDHIRVNVDNAGTGAFGLGIIAYFVNTVAASIAITGATGPSGGVTAWKGNWTTSTSYNVGDVVNSNGTTYVATTAHTSGASTQPGVGGSWTSDWMVLISGHNYSAVSYVIDGGGYVIVPGIKGPGFPVPFNAIIREASLYSDIVGSAVVDIWKDTFASYPPTVADSITSASPPTLSTANHTTDTTLSGWNTTITAGDLLRFNVNSVTAIRSLTVALKLERT